MYVDDLLTGADSEEGAYSLFAEARDGLAKAGMKLTKLSSNSSLVLDKASAMSGQSGMECHKVLGVEWDPCEDVFSFQGIDIPSDVMVTKRVILSFIARLFDPIGFLTPFVMLVKILFQKTWRLGLDWDEDVPEDIRDSFLKWLNGVQLLKQVHVPRSYGNCAWRDVTAVEIHAFGDAAESGYGSVVYLRLTLSDGSVLTPLVMSRARVAPLKRVSLPRLELLAALLAARLLVFVREALKLPVETPYSCWTDSTVVLNWVKGDSSRWKQFVRNRVTEIQGLTDPSRWRHCPGSRNVADLVTRGAFAEELVSCDAWFTGPAWLKDSQPCESSGPELSPPVAAEEEACVAEHQLISACSNSTSDAVIQVERYSSLTKAIRVVGLVLRFIRKLRSRCAGKGERSPPELTYQELSEAKVCLIRMVQTEAFPEEYQALSVGKDLGRCSKIRSLCPFIDEQGLLRVRTRLENTDMSLGDKCPVLIPQGHFAELVVAFQHRLLKHAGVDTLLTSLRCEYWILGARRLAKRVKRFCVACQKLDAAALNAPAAPLPADRATKAAPFSVIGVDYCGPLFCLPNKKVYILLISCAVTRAVHMELVDSLSLSDFLLAFRRFVGRRGLPSVVYSDNAATFKSAVGALAAEFGPTCPEWKFLCPKASWWAGFYERMVRTVKSSLKKTLGKRVLTKVELETLLVEVESCVNSRPLTFVSDDVTSPQPLTPSHFLTGRLAGTRQRVEDDSDQTSASSLRERELQHQVLLDTFWKVWHDQYLKNLPQSIRQFKARGKLQIGSVVLIREDNVPRLRWLMGVVEKLHSGAGGVVRAVDIRTVKGIRTRPVQKLHDLELLR